jgi:hypothetical protein
MHVWQSKQVLKSGPHWQTPSRIKNRPKAVSTEDWNREVKEWKYNKLLVLDLVPKISRKKDFATNERKENKNNDNNNR